MTLSWIAALDLDPSSSWLRMGTRRLGDRPWLVTDSNGLAELALRTALIEIRPGEVLAEPASSLGAARELEQLVGAAGIEMAADSTPLRRLGRSIQEDLCLLERTEQGWVLRAAVLCFPSRWRLRDKLDRTLGQVHRPVAGYEAALDAGVTKLIDGLAENVVLRRNWFLHPDGSLFQPDRPSVDPLVPADHCGGGIHVRSERQTLRLLPETGWCVFTIRIQYCTVRELADRRGPELRSWLEAAPPENIAHRGVPSEQAAELLAWLDARSADPPFSPAAS
jgi:hypothetical protein